MYSGSDDIASILRDDYRRVIEKLPLNAQFGNGDFIPSDFIIGFPGETDKDFVATMTLVREIEFAQAFSFKYSRRPGTPGAAMVNQIAEDIKDARACKNCSNTSAHTAGEI